MDGDGKALATRPLPQQTAAPLPAFSTTAWSEREREVLERYAKTPDGGLTTVKLAHGDEGTGLHYWAATQALDDLFQGRYWYTTDERFEDEGVIVKLTFIGQLDDGGVIVRQSYGGRGGASGKSFVVGGSRPADALKAALEDALKKLCATSFGMFQDVYRQRSEQEAHFYEKPQRRSPSQPRGGQAPRGGRAEAAAAEADRKAQRALFAAARENGLDSEEELKAFLKIPNEKGSLSALANHMCLAREKCGEEMCERPHGLPNRIAAFTAMRNWVVSAGQEEPRADED